MAFWHETTCSFCSRHSSQELLNLRKLYSCIMYLFHLSRSEPFLRLLLVKPLFCIPHAWRLPHINNCGMSKHFKRNTATSQRKIVQMEEPARKIREKVNAQMNYAYLQSCEIWKCSMKGNGIFCLDRRVQNFLTEKRHDSPWNNGRIAFLWRKRNHGRVTRTQQYRCAECWRAHSSSGRGMRSVQPVVGEGSKWYVRDQKRGYADLRISTSFI